MTTEVIAVHRLGVSDPLAETEFTGRYHDDGSPIVRKASRTIMPGETWTPPTATELQQLLDCGAVRLPDADDVATMERTAIALLPDGPAPRVGDTIDPFSGSLA